MAYPSMISIPLDMTPKLIVVHPDFSTWSDLCFSISGIQIKHVKEASFFSTLNHPRLQGEGFMVEKGSGKLFGHHRLNELLVDLKSTEALYV